MAALRCLVVLLVAVLSRAQSSPELPKAPTALVELEEGATELDAATAVAEDDAGRRGRRPRLQTTGSFAVSGSNR